MLKELRTTLVIAFAITLTTLSKEPKSIAQMASGLNSMSATIDSNSWFTFRASGSQNKNGELNISGSTGSKLPDTMVFIRIPSSAAIGTYNIDNSNYKLTLNNGPLLSSGANSGSITITANENSYIKGTFQGTFTSLPNTVTLTNGAFAVHIQ